MKLKAFGQRAYIEITDENKILVFSTRGGTLESTDLSEDLRVDFEVRSVVNYDIAIFKIYNLKSSTAKMISSNRKWATVKVSLHGENFKTIAHRYKISNVITVKQVPDSITTLYCEHFVKEEFLEKQLVHAFKDNPSLRNLFERDLPNSVGTQAQEIKHLYLSPEILDYRPPNPVRNANWSVMSMLQNLGKECGFSPYTQDEGVICIGRPTLPNVGLTTIPQTKGIILNVSDMKANPRLGISTVDIVTVLNTSIVNGVIIDISDLVGIGDSSLTPEVLAVVKDILNSVGGYNKYVVMGVIHKGSNYSDLWETTAMGLAPNNGLELQPVYNSLI